MSRCVSWFKEIALGDIPVAGGKDTPLGETYRFFTATSPTRRLSAKWALETVQAGKVLGNQPLPAPSSRSSP